MKKVSHSSYLIWALWAQMSAGVARHKKYPLIVFFKNYNTSLPPDDGTGFDSQT